eukprot:s406_g24.t1
MESTEAKDGPAEAKGSPTEEVGELEHDLRKLLQSKEVSSQAQRGLVKAGCRSMGIFSSVADNRAQLRSFAARTLKLAASNDAMEVAALIDAWETATIIAGHRRRIEANMATAGGGDRTPESEELECRKKFEEKFYDLDSSTCPAGVTMRQLGAQARSGKYVFVPLREFLAEGDNAQPTIQTAVNISGDVKVRKASGQVEEPRSPEGVGRLKVMVHTMVMAGMLCPQQVVLQELTPEDFKFYLQMVGRIQEQAVGDEAKAVSQMMDYDKKVRTAMVRGLNLGSQLKVALAEAVQAVDQGLFPGGGYRGSVEVSASRQRAVYRQRLFSVDASCAATQLRAVSGGWYRGSVEVSAPRQRAVYRQRLFSVDASCAATQLRAVSRRRVQGLRRGFLGRRLFVGRACSLAMEHVRLRGRGLVLGGGQGLRRGSASRPGVVYQQRSFSVKAAGAATRQRSVSRRRVQGLRRGFPRQKVVCRQSMVSVDGACEATRQRAGSRRRAQGLRRGSLGTRPFVRQRLSLSMEHVRLRDRGPVLGGGHRGSVLGRRPFVRQRLFSVDGGLSRQKAVFDRGFSVGGACVTMRQRAVSRRRALGLRRGVGEREVPLDQAPGRIAIFVEGAGPFSRQKRCPDEAAWAVLHGGKRKAGRDSEGGARWEELASLEGGQEESVLDIRMGVIVWHERWRPRGVDKGGLGRGDGSPKEVSDKVALGKASHCSSNSEGAASLQLFESDMPEVVPPPCIVRSIFGSKYPAARRAASLKKGSMLRALFSGSSDDATNHAPDARAAREEGSRPVRLLVIQADDYDWPVILKGVTLADGRPIVVYQTGWPDIHDLCGDSELGEMKTPSFDARSKLNGLMFAGVPCMNSLESIMMFCERPAVQGFLHQQHRRLGDAFPVVPQHFCSSSKSLMYGYTFPAVVKVGSAHAGVGKMKISDAGKQQRIQKIGCHYRAFKRIGISGDWKTNTCTSIMDEIDCTERYRQWADVASQLFGGLDILTVDAIIEAETGKELILEVNGTSSGLHPDKAQEDNQFIKELLLERMNAAFSWLTRKVVTWNDLGEEPPVMMQADRSVQRLAPLLHQESTAISPTQISTAFAISKTFGDPVLPVVWSEPAMAC